MTNKLKHFKTTLIGFAIGIYPLIQAIQEAYAAGYFTDKTGLQFWVSLGIIVLAYYSKDKSDTITKDAEKMDALAQEVAKIIGNRPKDRD